jgi:transposase-like protein
MNCPSCRGVAISPHGSTPAGSQRYKCRSCNKTWVDNPKQSGAKPIGDRAMTKSERNRKRYLQNKEKFNPD